eukprot:TRINITY_DN39699_c0_g1_i1.p1 TRINITY_DN39699_c0_g1~~TRINITY_DN39699_c0_g1_i1.p1  ORF type:complete len:859 (+),score=218.36 TRINITY_DN39699_c0_g1_i1:353-2578(+)
MDTAFTLARDIVTAVHPSGLAEGRALCPPTGAMARLAEAVDKVRAAVTAAIGSLPPPAPKAAEAAEELLRALESRVCAVRAIVLLSSALADAAPVHEKVDGLADACGKLDWDECESACDVARQHTPGLLWMAGARQRLRAAQEYGELHRLESCIGETQAAADARLSAWWPDARRRMLEHCLAPFKAEAERLHREQRLVERLSRAREATDAVRTAADRRKGIAELRKAAAVAESLLQGSDSAALSEARSLAAANAARLSALEFVDGVIPELSKPATRGGAAALASVLQRDGDQLLAAKLSAAFQRDPAPDDVLPLLTIAPTRARLPKVGSLGGAWLQEDSDVALNCLLGAVRAAAECFVALTEAEVTGLMRRREFAAAGKALRTLPPLAGDAGRLMLDRAADLHRALVRDSIQVAKVHFNRCGTGENRTAEISPEESYQKVREHLLRHLKVGPLEAERTRVQYQDRIGDFITIASDEEYRECWRQWAERTAAPDYGIQESDVLNLHVTVEPPPPQRVAAAPGAARRSIPQRRMTPQKQRLTEANLRQFNEAPAAARPPAEPRLQGKWVQQQQEYPDVAASESTFAALQPPARPSKWVQGQQEYPDVAASESTFAALQPPARPSKWVQGTAELPLVEAESTEFGGPDSVLVRAQAAAQLSPQRQPAVPVRPKQLKKQEPVRRSASLGKRVDQAKERRPTTEDRRTGQGRPFSKPPVLPRGRLCGAAAPADTDLTGIRLRGRAV